MVAGVQTRFPAHRFRRVSDIDSHHHVLRFGWKLVAPDGAVVVTGLDVGELAADGRLQRMALVVLDDELSSSPGGVVHVVHDGDSAASQLSGRGVRIGRVEIQMEVSTTIHEVDRWISSVHELEMEEAIAGAHASVEVLI